MRSDVVDGGSNPLATSSFASVDDARSVRFISLLHCRIPVIFDRIVRPAAKVKNRSIFLLPNDSLLFSFFLFLYLIHSYFSLIGRIGIDYLLIHLQFTFIDSVRKMKTRIGISNSLLFSTRFAFNRNSIQLRRACDSFQPIQLSFC